MPKALILSPFFYPEPISTGKYNTFLARQLASDGFDVDVWCSHPLYPSWKVSKTSVGMPGINISRGGDKVSYPKNKFARRVFLEVWFFVFVVLRFLVNRKKYDILVPVFPPSLFMICLPLFKGKFSKVFGIVHDLQGVYASRHTGILSKILAKLITACEARAFKSCDHISYLSDSMMQIGNSSYGISRKRTSVHYPFITIEKFENLGALSEVIPDGEKSLVYSGALGEKQNPKELVELIKSVTELDNNVIAHVFSMGPIFDDLKEKYQSKKVKFHGLVEEEELPELLVRSTVQIIPQIEGSSSGSLPSKLPNLISSGVKLFCITDKGGDLDTILSGRENCIVVNSWNIDENAESLVKLLNSEHVDVADVSLQDKFKKETLVRNIARVSAA